LTDIVSQCSPISAQISASHLYEKLFRPAVEKVVAQFMNEAINLSQMSLEDKHVLNVLFTICSIIGPASRPSVTK